MIRLYARQTNRGWQYVGEASVLVQNRKVVEWCDIVIVEEARNRGFGSKIVQFLINYLRINGIHEIWGEISPVDHVGRAVNFWRKNGFSVNLYSQPKDGFVAGISMLLSK